MVPHCLMRTAEVLTSLPVTETLRTRLEHAAALRRLGRIEEAIACGPGILRAYFEQEHGHEHPRAAPRTFTDKLYSRMLDVHEHGCPTFSTLSDKLAVRDFVAGRIGEEFLTPLIWSGADAREIPWSRLPAEFVLKCSEGSGKVMLMNAPCDAAAVERMATGWQAHSFYWQRREYHYWPVPRRLLIEPRLDDGHPDGPLDYIFFCFDGVPRLLQVGSRSHTIHRFFTPGWEPIALTYRKEYETPHVPRPPLLERMLDVAARLSRGFDFVRVDLYACKDGIRFGELTFTPVAGKVLFQPQEWDARLGDWWRYAGLPDAA